MISERSKTKTEKERILYYYELGFNLSWIAKITGYSYVTVHNYCKGLSLPRFDKLTDEKKKLIENLVKEECFSIIFLVEVTKCSAESVLDYLYELVEQKKIKLEEI